jgi:hypothetical protein
MLCFFSILFSANELAWYCHKRDPMPYLLNLENLVNLFEKSFYTPPFMVALNAAFLVMALLLKLGTTRYAIFIYYSAAALLQDILYLLLLLANKTFIKNDALVPLVNEYLTVIFIQIEFIIFYNFFYNQFSQQHIKHIISTTGKIFAAITAILSLFVFVFEPITTIKAFEGWISVIGSILILTPSFYYFYTLFSEPPEKLLVQEPAFWITTGIAFLHGVNIPVFIIKHYLLKAYTTIWYNLYSLNYFSYCILFLLLIISLLCNLRKEKQNGYIFTS